MALKIKQQDTIFNVEGHINVATVKQFKDHLEFLLLYTKSLTINIDKVEEIDTSGIQAFHDLYTTAIIYNKKFEIMGYGCKDIYNEILHQYAN